jgi:hypothetical protein
VVTNAWNFLSSSDGFSDAANAGAQDADVVDADFEEIKDDDKK